MSHEQHAYFSLIFEPIVTGTKLARISTTVASLFVTLVISATFYQDTQGATLTMSTVERKVFAGFVSSIIVFVPFAIIGYLMRRVKHAETMRTSKVETFEMSEATPANAAEKDIYDDHIQDDQLFLPKSWADFYVPVWGEYLLYALLLAGSLASEVIAIFYGVQFDDAVAANWIESFFIGWAVSALFLQTIQSLLGAIFATVIGAASTFATGIALLVTNSVINN